MTSHGRLSKIKRKEVNVNAKKTKRIRTIKKIKFVGKQF